MKRRSLLVGFALLAFAPAFKTPGANLWAWGDNTYGQTNVPPDLTNAVAISAGADFGLALKGDGTVVAWGNNAYGACNIPPGLSNVVAISSYDEESIGLEADGTVAVWGNTYGVQPGLSGVVGVAQALWCNLALKSDGTVAVWPQNAAFGQSDVPADLTNAVAISGGGEQCLALRADGRVAAWPASFGSVPEDLTNAIAISAGYRHSLALRADGRVSAWGDNTGGPCDVPADLTNAIAISAGDSYSLALRADGTVVQWGDFGLGFHFPAPPFSGVTALASGDLFALALGAEQPMAIAIPFISPPNQTIGSGSQAFFSVAATGAAPLSYQWYFFGTNAIPGATNRWFALRNALPSQSGLYSVVVRNGQGSATSPSVTLDVVPSLDIALAPAINLKGETGSTYRIDYVAQVGTTNDWLPLATVTLTNNQQWYGDFSAIGQPARFYRLVQVP